MERTALFGRMVLAGERERECVGLNKRHERNQWALGFEVRVQDTGSSWLLDIRRQQCQTLK